MALIPDSPGSYVMYDPSSNEFIRITKENAAMLAPEAYMFFRNFPEEKITARGLFKFCVPEIRADLIKYGVLGLICALVGLLAPEMTRILVDDLIPQAAIHQIIQAALLILMCSVSAVLFEVVKSVALLRFDLRSTFALQSAVVDRILRLPVSFFKKYVSGDLAERVLAITQIKQTVSGTLLSTVMSFLFSLVYFFQLFRYSPLLARQAVLLSLVPVLLSCLVNWIQFKWDTRLNELNGRLSGTVLQMIMGIQKIFITSSTKRAFAKWQKDYFAYKNLTYKSAYASNVFGLLSSVFSIATTLFFYSRFMRIVSSPGGGAALTTGTFLAFMTAFGSFSNSLIATFSAMIQIVSTVPLYRRVKPVLEESPEVTESKPSVLSLKGKVEVSNLNFRYSPDGGQILDNVSIKINPGEFVAVVGSSGSGKSTLLRLLLGFEKPESGSIFYDDKDISTIDVTSLRRCIGTVLQNGTIMQGSIYENIAGSLNLTLDDAWAAAEKVGFDKDIRNMPMGMHTLLPPGGTTLSGGQRQRLMIARAIIRDANVLFFDEATSALDNQTQKIVSDSLRSLNVSRLVIAHRLSTVIDADRIYVLEKGRVIETGTYSELMAQNGFFAALAKRQQI